MTTTTINGFSFSTDNTTEDVTGVQPSVDMVVTA